MGLAAGHPRGGRAALAGLILLVSMAVRGRLLRRPLTVRVVVRVVQGRTNSRIQLVPVAMAQTAMC